MEVNKQKT